MVSYEIEPFMDYGKHAKPGAFPHADSLLPVGPPCIRPWTWYCELFC